MAKKSGWKSFFWKSSLAVVFVFICLAAFSVYSVHEEMEQTNSPYCSTACHEMEDAAEAMRKSPHGFIQNCTVCHVDSLEGKTNKLFVHVKGLLPPSLVSVSQGGKQQMVGVAGHGNKIVSKMSACIDCHVYSNSSRYTSELESSERKIPLIGEQVGHLIHVLRNDKIDCKGCHFGGELFHNPIPTIASEMGKRCSECHETKKVNYAKHKANDLSCLDCHNFKKRTSNTQSISMAPERKACASIKGCHGDPHVQKVSKGSKSMIKFTRSQPCGTCHMVHKNETIKNAVHFQSPSS